MADRIAVMQNGSCKRSTRLTTSMLPKTNLSRRRHPPMNFVDVEIETHGADITPAIALRVALPDRGERAAAYRPRGDGDRPEDITVDPDGEVRGRCS